MQKFPPLKSFTLIELLIVITIIGILAVALIPRIAGAPARARDVQRKADLQNISAALELYYSDNGKYPTTGTPPEVACPGSAGTFDTAVKGYLSGNAVPSDPSGSKSLGACSSTYFYKVFSSTSYILVATLENKTSSGQNIYCDVQAPTNWNTLAEFFTKSSPTCPGTDKDPKYVIYR